MMMKNTRQVSIRRRNTGIVFFMITTLLLTFVANVQGSTTTTISSRHLQREEGNNHAPCQMYDLVDACPDKSVQADALNAECLGLHSISAAKCYMEYLCEHHDQETVKSHKECIDLQCPLAKHVPPLDCATWNAKNGGEGEGEESTTTEEGEEEYTAAEESNLEGEREEGNNHAPCQMHDLVDACPDKSVQADALNAECEGLHSIPAAKCYMEYLCEHHDQETAKNHKECIDSQCPLAKHVPLLDCATWNAENGGEGEESTTTEEEGNEENAAAETKPEEETETAEGEAETEAEPQVGDTVEGEGGEEGVELIHEAATVALTRPPSAKEDTGGKGAKVAGVIILVFGGVYAFVTYRNRYSGYSGGAVADHPNLAPYAANREFL